MKWTPRQCKLEEKFNNCEKRIIKRLLIIPREINCETRWLEFVSIKQKVKYYSGGLLTSGGYYWDDEEWINE